MSFFTTRRPDIVPVCQPPIAAHYSSTGTLNHLVRVEAEGIDGAGASLHRYDRDALFPVPDVYRALAVRTDRAQQPAIVAEVEATDLEMRTETCTGVRVNILRDSLKHSMFRM